MPTKVRLSANDISKKWNNNLKGAVQYIQQGVDRVETSPTEQAADSQDKMLQHLQQAVSSGKWGNALRKVSLQQWKQTMKQKVQARLAGGVDQAMDKRQAFDKYLVDTLNNVLPEIDSMPSMTLEDSVARVRRLMEYMNENAYKK